MKSRFPLPRPRRADGTILPAALAALLVLGLVLQLLGSGAPPVLPPVLPVGAAAGVAPPPPVARGAPARVIFQRPLFAPRQSPFATGGSTSAMMLGGAVVAGTVTKGSRTVAIVRRPSGAVSSLPIGGVIEGWRLIALKPEGAVFVKGGARQVLPYGTAAVVAPAGEEPEAQ